MFLLLFKLKMHFGSFQNILKNMIIRFDTNFWSLWNIYNFFYLTFYLNVYSDNTVHFYCIFILFYTFLFMLLVNSLDFLEYIRSQ